MIPKIKPQDGDGFFDSVCDHEDEWGVVWGVSFVGFVSLKMRDELTSVIRKFFRSFKNHFLDQDATFPFALREGQTRRGRLCEELSRMVSERCAGLGNYYRPIQVDYFFLGLSEGSRAPEFLVGNTALEASQGTETVVLRPEHPLQPSSFGSGLWTLSLPQVFEFWDPHAQLFQWRVSVPEVIPPAVQLPEEKEDELSDAGFAVNFEDLANPPSPEEIEKT